MATPVLRDRWAALKQRAEAISQGDQAAAEGARYQEAGRHFEEATVVLSKATALLGELKRANVPCDALEGSLEDAQASIAVLKDGSNLEGHEFEALAVNLSQSAINTARDIEHAVSDSLREWLTNQPAPHEEFLDVLDAVSASDVRPARALVREFNELQTDVSDPKEITSLIKTAIDLRQVYDDLVSHLPAAVREFLEGVPAGVGLDQVQDNVLDWIRDNDAQASFIVRLKR